MKTGINNVLGALALTLLVIIGFSHSTSAAEVFDMQGTTLREIPGEAKFPITVEYWQNEADATAGQLLSIPFVIISTGPEDEDWLSINRNEQELTKFPLSALELNTYYSYPLPAFVPEARGEDDDAVASTYTVVLHTAGANNSEVLIPDTIIGPSPFTPRRYTYRLSTLQVSAGAAEVFDPSTSVEISFTTDHPPIEDFFVRAEADPFDFDPGFVDDPEAFPTFELDDVQDVEVRVSSPAGLPSYTFSVPSGPGSIPLDDYFFGDSASNFANTRSPDFLVTVDESGEVVSWYLRLAAAADNSGQVADVFVLTADFRREVGAEGKTARASELGTWSFEEVGERAQVVSAVLPSSRAPAVGQVATAFATILNSGALPAINCTVALPDEIAAQSEFFFQATDPLTNEAVGSRNEAVDIPSGDAQSFYFGVTPSAPFPTTEVALEFRCGSAVAPSIAGLSTIQLSGNATPVADVVALTSSVDLAIPVGGASAFAVASFNVGTVGDLLVRTSLTTEELPVMASICQTDPLTAICIRPTAPAKDFVLSVGESEAQTFSVFVQALGPIAFDPANTRIRVEFLDATTGEPRGSTSVAIRAE